jgi:hypothetical protein
MYKRVLFTSIDETYYPLCHANDICERCGLEGHNITLCRTYIMMRNPPKPKPKPLKKTKKISNNIFDVLNSDDEMDKTCNEKIDNKVFEKNVDYEEEKRRQNEYEDIMNILR